MRAALVEVVAVDDDRVAADGDGPRAVVFERLEEAWHTIDLDLLVAVVARVHGVDEPVELLAWGARRELKTTFLTW